MNNVEQITNTSNEDLTPNDKQQKTQPTTNNEQQSKSNKQ